MKIDHSTLKTTHRLQAADLKRYTDPATLPKSSRSRLPQPEISFGQVRAIKAINTALDIRASGYHVFAVGENSLGKRTLITRLLTERAKTMPTPDDWVYVHHFDDSRRPIAINFPAGMAVVFQQKVHKLWQLAKKKLAAKLLGDTEKAHEGCQIGSYPFFREGRNGANFVVRSTDPDALKSCVDTLCEGLGELGWDFTPGGI